MSQLPNGTSALWIDRRADSTGPASIALATFDGVGFADAGLALTPPAGLSYEDPMVLLEPVTGELRMWLTVRTLGDPADPTDDTSVIAHTTSADGLEWGEPEVVLAGARPLAAPSVTRTADRFRMWAASWNGVGWDHAETWSYDGLRWTRPEVVIPGTPAAGPVDAPRIATLIFTSDRWRLEGDDVGPVVAFDDAPLVSGRGPVAFDFGFALALAQGMEVSNEEVPDGQARLGLVPGSVVSFGGRRYLWATAEDAGGVRRITSLVEGFDGAWTPAVAPSALEAMLDPEDSTDHLLAPVVAAADGELVMLYTRFDPREGTLTPARAVSSTGGATWTVLDGPVFEPAGPEAFDAVSRVPHSIQEVSGGFRLWYTGSNGAETRIGSAFAASLRGTFVPEPGPAADYRLGLGELGAFDQVAVADPLAVELDGVTHLYYAGYDGLSWAVGHAVLGADGRFVRDPADEDRPALLARPLGFAAQGARSPVLASALDGGVELLFAGLAPISELPDRLDPRFDDHIARVGRGIVDGGLPEVVFPAPRFPTVGDQIGFVSGRGGPGAQVIELETRIENLVEPGIGMSSLTLDPDRGFLYVTSKLSNRVLVVDVRDDSASGFEDRNYLDLEAVIEVRLQGATGFMSATRIPDRDLLALTMRFPDGLALLDVAGLVDDDDIEIVSSAPRAYLPMLEEGDRQAVPTATEISGYGAALAPDGRTLLVAHFNGGGVSVFDLGLGPWGEEIAWIRNVGGGAHQVRISPDGRYAVVANYIGEIDDDVVSATLAVLDVDPTSEQYLEVVAWLVNR